MAPGAPLAPMVKVFSSGEPEYEVSVFSNSSTTFHELADWELMADNLPQEIDLDPPIRLTKWNPACVYLYQHCGHNSVTVAQKCDIANLFVFFGSYLTSNDLHVNPPVLPVAGPYNAGNVPPLTLQMIWCSGKLSQGFVEVIQNDPFFAAFPGGGATLFTLLIGANPTFHVNVKL